MLSRESWLPQAEKLNLRDGESRRVEHDCGEGRVLKIERDPDGLRAWCFRCGEGGSVSVELSLAERLARLAVLREADAVCGGVQCLPEPPVHDVDGWPVGARLWLYRAGLGRDDIARLGIYWHAASDRVVVPVECGEGTFYQARAWQKGRSPKYLGPTPRPGTLIARWAPDCDVQVAHGRQAAPQGGPGLLPGPGYAAPVPGSVTLTEDLLSAIKIGKVAEAWCILGTSLSRHMLACLLRLNRPVNVWTDPDEAGQKAASKIVKQLNGFGIPSRRIVSARDPKLHHLHEIKEYLCPSVPALSVN